MPRVLPPLQHVPHLERLLAPREQIIYTVKLHWLHGWPFLLASLVFLGLGYFWWGLALPGLVFITVYGIPFNTNEIAVTTHRLLVRLGRFQLRMEGVTSDRLEEWHLTQTAVQNVLRSGHVTIMVKEGKDLRPIVIAHMAHPLSFIEALETLQPQLKNGGIHATH